MKIKSIHGTRECIRKCFMIPLLFLLSFSVGAQNVEVHGKIVFPDFCFCAYGDSLKLSNDILKAEYSIEFQKGFTGTIVPELVISVFQSPFTGLTYWTDFNLIVNPQNEFMALTSSTNLLTYATLDTMEGFNLAYSLNYLHLEKYTVASPDSIEITNLSNDTIVQDFALRFDTTYCSNFNNQPGTTIVYDTVVVYDTVFVYDSIRVTDTLFIDVVLFKDNKNIENRIKVYPNPAKDKIYLNRGEYSTLMEEFRVTIVESNGSLIYSTLMSQDVIEINLTEFKKTGLFFLNVYDAKNMLIEVKKIVLE